MEAVKKAAGAEASWWRGGSSEDGEDEDELSLGWNHPPQLRQRECSGGSEREHHDLLPDYLLMSKQHEGRLKFS